MWLRGISGTLSSRSSQSFKYFQLVQKSIQEWSSLLIWQERDSHHGCFCSELQNVLQPACDIIIISYYDEMANAGFEWMGFMGTSLGVGRFQWDLTSVMPCLICWFNVWNKWTSWGFIYCKYFSINLEFNIIFNDSFHMHTLVFSHCNPGCFRLKCHCHYCSFLMNISPSDHDPFTLTTSPMICCYYQIQTAAKMKLQRHRRIFFTAFLCRIKVHEGCIKQHGGWNIPDFTFKPFRIPQHFGINLSWSIMPFLPGTTLSRVSDCIPTLTVEAVK